MNEKHLDNYKFEIDCLLAFYLKARLTKRACLEDAMILCKGNLL